MAVIGDVVNITVKQFSRRKKKVLDENGDQIEIESIIADSPRNVLLAMKSDSRLNDFLRHNEFTGEHEIVADVKLDAIKLKKGQLPSAFESYLSVYLENHFKVVFKAGALRDGIEAFFAEKTYNPVQEYMETAFESWDHKERLAQVFQTWLGAEDSVYVRQIAIMFFVGAVSKVFNPFIKFDYTLDLVGGQGAGKTTFLQKIAGEWYTDSAKDFMDKDNYEIMLKSLIVNDDEMVASRKTTFDELKAFVTKTDLTFRRSYGRRAEKYPKNFVIARTSNKIEYLGDKTGERRFLPILVDADNQFVKPFDMTDQDVMQLWGEAVAIYKRGYTLTFDDDFEEELAVYKERFTYKDEAESQIYEYLDMLVPEEWDNFTIVQQHQYTFSYFNGGTYRDEIGNKYEGINLQSYVSSKQILKNVFDVDVARGDKLARKIKLIMDNHSDWEYKIRKVNNRSTRAYFRKNTQNE
ncbi:VapE domain-containing protein [Streptococcus urinalis]|uniref:Virulence-associated protein E n=1 Tax=Streptococcus urinalis 2285-97 TaxID=764291 RepID=G5KEQ5_9STRE|nr:virulence-associated E family protein [Streptococcus urinalis]EHJ56811.1 virulence-associated protein E [Streptococcus urinalis 2285-97]QBX22228.1 virulence-associated protein E [Streptococcus phage Javan645]QBX31549.1 virulence-associated protein E [Streptococcus phage Javan640]VEF32955.1 phage protein [Streptococcus urinalis]